MRKIILSIVAAMALSACSFVAKPDLSAINAPTPPRINAPVTVEFAGTSEVWQGTVKKAWSCGMGQFSMDTESTMKSALQKHIENAFYGSSDNPYAVAITLETLSATMADENFGERALLGIFAGPPKMRSEAFMTIGVQVSREGTDLIKDKIRAHGAVSSEFWACDEMNETLERAISSMAADALEKINTQVLAPIAAGG